MPSFRKKTVTLLLGGARSGKSRYAQELAAAFKRVVYIATAQPSDAEMRARIARHRRERPPAWKTVEVRKGLDLVLREESSGADLVLVDCLTVYMANIMGRTRAGGPRVRSHIHALCGAIQEAEASVILVSNEVGCGVVPPYQSGRDYRDLLGELNQQIAKVADNVILMVAGLPLTVKGLPGGI
jgi:adenosylcobinamide kinase/adenosylcobinamide-phosphate guanylyltransferase